ncbi:MAG: RNA polymerase sigma factor [Bacteroidota bacterium]|nr:RNA polymerase sigma factor [Bacteroidota bacterium]
MTRLLNSLDEAELLSRHVTGDNDAFLELFTRLNYRIFMYARKFVGTNELAEDVTQETWERIIALRGHAVEIDNAVGYIFKTVRNLCLNCLKARRRTDYFSQLEESHHPNESVPSPSDVEEIVNEAFERLAFKEKEVLILQYYSGYTPTEIAGILGTTPEVVWKRASRARKKLREMVISHPAFHLFRSGKQKESERKANGKKTKQRENVSI